MDSILVGLLEGWLEGNDDGTDDEGIKVGDAVGTEHCPKDMAMLSYGPHST